MIGMWVEGRIWELGDVVGYCLYGLGVIGRTGMRRSAALSLKRQPRVVTVAVER